MRSQRVAPLVYKEFRALLLTWLACGLVVALGLIPSLRSINSVSVQLLAYVFGTLALGAQSIGHEYGHRTLALQLSQPIDRRRLLVAKASVLLPMLVALTTMMWWILLTQPLRSTESQLMLIVGPPLAGLLIAPSITMLSRNQLAGTLLTWTLIAAVWLFAELWEFSPTALLLPLCAAGGILSWRLFMGLDAIDGPGAALDLPRRRRARARHGHPLVQLIKKELHLQQLSFAIVGIYLVAWAGIVGTQRRLLDLSAFPLAHLNLLYTALICLVIGSLASAEERQFGTLQWQTLLPVPRWQQWSIKVGVTMALTLLLGVGLPLLLMRLSPSPDDRTLAVQMPLLTVALIVAVTLSLYVSSISTSGVRALVLAVPAVLGTIAFGRAVASLIVVSVPALGPSGKQLFLPPAEFYRYLGALVFGFAGVMLFVVLRFAAINHSLADRSVWRINQQLAWIAGLLTFGLLTLQLAH